MRTRSTTRMLLASVAAAVTLAACSSTPAPAASDSPSLRPVAPTTAAPAASGPATPSPTPSASPTAAAVVAEGCTPGVPATLRPHDAPDLSATATTTSPAGLAIDVTTARVDTADAIGETINADIDARAARTIAEWEQVAVEDNPESSFRSELWFTIEVVEVRPATLSVLLDGERYYAGAASGSGLRQAATYSLTNGLPLTLADLGVGPPCLAAVGSLVGDALIAADVDVFDEALAEVREGSYLESFVLTEDAIVFHFPQYQVSPGFVGNVEVPIDLETLLDATGIDLRG